jgi:hypothetical protein
MILSILGFTVLAYSLFVTRLAVLRGGQREFLWSHIFALPWIWFAFNYPIRAIVLGSQLSSNSYVSSPALEDSELISALIFATAFYSIMGGLVIFAIGSRTPSLRSNSRSDVWACRVLFGLSVSSLAFRLYTGRVFGLYESEADLQTDFLSNLILSLDILKWATLMAAALLWAVAKESEHLFMVVVLTALILAIAVLSSSKGPIFQMVCLYLVGRSLIRKRVQWSLVIPGVVLAVLYGAVSYLQRTFTLVRGRFEFGSVQGSFYDLLSAIERLSLDDLWDLGGESLLLRLNYLDALALSFRRFGEIDNPMYQFGGMSELLTVIPRMFWSDRPIINFNFYATEFVWGHIGVLAETPIGRAGEAALVLGWGGLLMGAVYGLLFGQIGRFFLSGPQTPIRLGAYCALLVGYVWPDSHAVFLWKNVAVIGVVVWLTERYAVSLATNPRFRYRQ